MKKISQRLLMIRKQMGLTQVQFSKKIGTTQNVYTRYETGKLELPDSLKNNLHLIGVNLNWLITGSGSMFQTLQQIDASFLDNTISIPIVGEIAAGTPAENFYEYPLHHLDIPRALLHYPPPYMVFRIAGDSMAPHILPADIVIISQDWRNTHINGKIMAFRTQDGITLKKLIDDPKNRSTLLLPLNSSHHPTIYIESDPDIQIIGILDLAIRHYNR